MEGRRQEKGGSRDGASGALSVPEQGTALGGPKVKGPRWQEPSSLSLVCRTCPCPEALGQIIY